MAIPCENGQKLCALRASAVKLEYSSAKRTKAAANFVFFARFRAFRDPNASPRQGRWQLHLYNN
jgi:hypothetical protein